MADHPASRNRRRVTRNTVQTKRSDGLVWDVERMQFAEKKEAVPNIIIPEGIPEFLY